ncbi:MAG: GNAT family N-acetyltransferase [Oscillospiraceae bacterium]|nr:GNAT family N-acetyltransferase [Oscillospiraceae bacterium]
MNDVQIRDLEETDVPALKALVAEAFGTGWNLRRYRQNRDLLQALLDVYLSIFLEPATFGRVAVLDGEVVGVAAVSVKGEPAKFRPLQTNIAPNTLTLLTAAEADRTDITEHIAVSFQAIGGLLANRIDTYGGGLELLIVSERAQGLHIGKTLWEEASAYFKSKDAKHIYLIADSACNVGFYDHNGFIRTAAQEAVYNYTTGQRKSTVFVYEYQF